MRTLQLGTTSVHVSALCLGGNNIGATANDDESFRLLDHFASRGGNFLDTANMYSFWIASAGAGSSESCIGRWMKARRNRDKIVVATKMGMNFPGHNNRNAPEPPVERGLRRDQIINECDKSLRRLQTDYIDLYYAHADDRDTPQEESIAAFDSLVKAGKVRLIGASNFQAWRLATARTISRYTNAAAYCCIQQHYTYVRPNPGHDFLHNAVADEGLLDYCKSERVTLVAYSPLLGGAYDRPEKRWRIPWLPKPNDVQYRGPDADARLAALEQVAREINASNNQTVLAWMLHSDPPVIPLFGASSTQQLDDNIAATELKLTSEQMTRLNSARA